jgi:hypothetical protein
VLGAGVAVGIGPSVRTVNPSSQATLVPVGACVPAVSVSRCGPEARPVIEKRRARAWDGSA